MPKLFRGLGSTYGPKHRSETKIRNFPLTRFCRDNESHSTPDWDNSKKVNLVSKAIQDLAYVTVIGDRCTVLAGQCLRVSKRF